MPNIAKRQSFRETSKRETTINKVTFIIVFTHFLTFFRQKT